MRSVMLSVCVLALLVWTGAALADDNPSEFYAVKDGSWTDNTVWDQGFPPDDPSDDNAWIGGGYTVTVTNHTATPKRLRPGCDPAMYANNNGDGTVIVGENGVVDLTLGGAQYA